MNSPPVLASLLLHAVAPHAFAHCVEGDLQEEFSSIQIVERGHLGARWWYWRQVLRSIQLLLASGLRSSNWQISALIILLATAGEMVVLDAWWSFILSQIPLKEDNVRGIGYLTASLVLTLILSTAAGSRFTLRGLALALPAAAIFSLLGVSAIRGIVPAWFAILTIAANFVGLYAGSRIRHARQRRLP